MAGTSRFTQEQRARAVRLVAGAGPSYPAEWAAIESVAAKLGASAETVRTWIRQGQIDVGQRPARPARSRRRSGGCAARTWSCELKAAAAFFGAELDRPHPHS